jgi:hypothetical protein
MNSQILAKAEIAPPATLLYLQAEGYSIGSTLPRYS